MIQIPRFQLHVEFNCPADSNSGVYLRGRYELQVETDSIRTRPVTGWAACTVFCSSPSRPAGLENGRLRYYAGRALITVVQNGRTTIDNQEIPGLRVAPLTATKSCRDLLPSGSEKGRVCLPKYRHHTSKELTGAQ